MNESHSRFKHGYRLELGDGYEHLHQFLLDLPDRFPGNGRVLHDARNHLKSMTVEGLPLVVKSFQRLGLLRRLIYSTIRAPKAVRSYRHARHLQSLGINTAEPVGYIEFYNKFGILTDSYFLAREVDYDYPVAAIIHEFDMEERGQHRISDEKRDRMRAILRQCAGFTARMHSQGVLHLDYSKGNLLIKENDGEAELTVIDVNRMKFRPVTPDLAAENLVRFLKVPQVRNTFINHYAPLRGVDEAWLRENVEEKVRRHNRWRRWRHRIKDFLRSWHGAGQTHVHRWDSRSDQPERIRERRVKYRIRLSTLPAHLKTLLVGLAVAPKILWHYCRLDFSRAVGTVDTTAFFGLCTNLMDQGAELIPGMVRELGIDKLLIRVHIGESEALDRHVRFLESLGPASIVITVLQDREHVLSLQRTEASIRQIFSKLGPYAHCFQIGNAVNRSKWAIYSMDEYLAFYTCIQTVRDREFPDIALMGSSVIDFDLLGTIRTLFHRFPCYFDKVASLLYIDRRGAPEQCQVGIFDLRNKIRAIAAVVSASRKADPRLVITEINWPLQGHGKFAPASGHCCVSESRYAEYLIRYYLLALSTGLVETVYCHQLVARGYGLVDIREGEVVIREAFVALKTLVRMVRGSRCRGLRVKDDGCYEVSFIGDDMCVSAIWATREITFPNIDCDSLYDQSGNRLASRPQSLGGRVHYCYSTTHRAA